MASTSQLQEVSIVENKTSFYDSGNYNKPDTSNQISKLDRSVPQESDSTTDNVYLDHVKITDKLYIRLIIVVCYLNIEMSRIYYTI